jgi:hypothetical protein
MALPANFSLLDSELNDFLFAQLGEEENGLSLTVLSALKVGGAVAAASGRPDGHRRDPQSPGCAGSHDASDHQKRAGEARSHRRRSVLARSDVHPDVGRTGRLRRDFRPLAKRVSVSRPSSIAVARQLRSLAVRRARDAAAPK